MKFLIQILSTVLLFFSFSCRENNKSSEYVLSGIPYENNDNDIHGIIDAHGNIIVSGFKNAVSPIINGYFVKEVEDGAHVLCKVEGDSYTIISSALGYDAFGVMNNGLIPACKENEHIVILNEQGEVVFTLNNYEDSDVVGCASYNSNKLRVKLLNGYVIYVDKDGKKLFDKSYEWGTDFINDRAIVCSCENDYALITGDGDTIFSFKGEDEDAIKISHEYELICSKGEDEFITIYDFNGNVICKCPKKVEEISDFGKEYFIYKKDYEYGLMNYSGTELIGAKYDQLVFNGITLLAIHEDRNDEVLILDTKGHITGTLDGEDIFSAKEYGFDFPNIIQREDNEIYLVNKQNETIGSGPLNIDVDLEDLEYVYSVRSQYFPKDDVLNIVMGLCGDGKGLPKDQGAFFTNGSTLCHPSNVKLVSNCPKDQLIGKRTYNTCVSDGVNYSINFEVSFNECIIREDTSELNSSAWLNGMKITVFNSSIIQNASFFNLCRQTLEYELDCEVTVTGTNGVVLTSNNHENLIILDHGKGDCFYIFLRQRNESTLSYWRNYIRG